MLDAIDPLRDDDRLRLLLDYYRRCRKQQPEAEWHDRLMEIPDTSPDQVSRLHGMLLANGWVDTRVHLDAFAVAGRLSQCYRVTPGGIRALSWLENPIELEAEAASEAPTEGW